MSSFREGRVGDRRGKRVGWHRMGIVLYTTDSSE